MKLLEVKLGGFCNIKSTHLRFGENITSLVSTNNYGKSNLIKALNFALNFIKASPTVKSEMMSSRFIPLNKYTARKNFFIELIFEFELSNKIILVKYGFEFEWLKNNINGINGKRIIKEWLMLSHEGMHSKYSSFISRGETARYKNSLTGRCYKHIKVMENELVVNKLMLEDNLHFYDIIQAINNANMYIERHLDVESMYLPTLLQIKGQDDFDLDTIEDIPKILYKLREKYSSEYERVINAFSQIFPDLVLILGSVDLSKDIKDIGAIPDDIPYSISNVHYHILVKDKNLNQVINFSMLSDGTKRLLALFLCVVIADKKGLNLIAIEEPENSIHPALLQDFINVIKQLAGNSKILIASHSPYILQYVNTEDIYIGRPNDNGIADFVRIAHKKQKSFMREISKENSNVGSYIFDLLSGGSSSIEILNNYLENETDIKS